MIRKSPYIDENYATLMSSDLNLVLTNNTNNASNINFEENSLNFSKMSVKKMDEEKSGTFNSLIEEKTPEKNENPLMRKKKIDTEQLSIFNKTFNMMMQGAKENTKKFENPNSAFTSIVKCSVCGSRPEQPPNNFSPEHFIKCLLCKTNVCCLCISKCSECAKTLCKICTVVNYDQSFDRVLCVECNLNNK